MPVLFMVTDTLGAGEHTLVVRSFDPPRVGVDHE